MTRDGSGGLRGDTFAHSLCAPGGGGGFVVEGAVGPPLTLVRPLLVQRVNSGEISVYSIVELTSFTVNTIQNRRFVLVGPPQPTRPP